jgi:hypothetical protein
MQDMIAEYRACTDRTLVDNFKRKACLTAIEEKRSANVRTAEIFCSRRKYVFDASRMVCILPGD